MAWAMAAADLIVALLASEELSWPKSPFEPWYEQGWPFGWTVRIVRSVLVGEGMLAVANHPHPCCSSCCSRVPRGLWLFGGGGTCGVVSILLPYFTGCNTTCGVGSMSGMGNYLVLLSLSVRWLVLLAGLACWLGLLVVSGCGCLRLVAALGGCCLAVGWVVVWAQGCS